jgi:hypothetical protein
MATDLKSHADNVSLTRFFGGKQHGACVQVTTNPSSNRTRGTYVQLTRQQAAALALDLMDFAAGREVEDLDN